MPENIGSSYKGICNCIVHIITIIIVYLSKWYGFMGEIVMMKLLFFCVLFNMIFYYLPHIYTHRDNVR